MGWSGRWARPADGWLVTAAACSPVTAVELSFGPVADLMARLSVRVGSSMEWEQVWRALSPITGEHPQGPVDDQDSPAVPGFRAFLSAVSRVQPR